MRGSHDAQLDQPGEVLVIPGFAGPTCSSGPAWLVEAPSGKRHALDTALTMIGRSAPSHVALGADPYLSRRHAAIQHHDAGWWFVDLQSANGSFINQRPVCGPQRLESGDVIQIGMTRLRFETAFSGSGSPVEAPNG
jgi:pSer/pThr/pTyr-binding forkhead associated (FHA) protein